MKSDQHDTSQGRVHAVHSHRLLFNPTAESLPATFPFPTCFTLDLLFERIRRLAHDEPDIYGWMVESIDAALASTPVLREPIHDYSILHEHRRTLELLLKPFFPSLGWMNELLAMGAPFGECFFYYTAHFQQILPRDNDRSVLPLLDSSTRYTRILYAYRAILAQYYNYEMALDQPAIMVIPDGGGKIDRYFKVMSGPPYMRIRNLKPVPDLSTADLDHLLHHVDDLALWMERLPPDHFEFAGFALIHLIDVTNEVSTASLKDILLTSDATVTEENFDLIQREVRTLFRKPHLQLGLASIQGNGQLNVDSDRKIWNSLRIRDAMRDGSLAIGDTFYGQVLQEEHSVAISDLHDLPSEMPVRRLLLEQGVRSILVAPLRYEGRMVGLLELSSSQPGDLQALATLKLRQIESIFALAIHQNLKRFEERVTAIIQQTYTAIHPTVAWRFREAAIAMLDRHKHQGFIEAEPILFQDLFPLYGSADIRNSSQHRNEAIRLDLIEHLEHASTMLATARAAIPLTLIEELHHRVDMRIAHLRGCWNTGDESSVADFVRREINPLLEMLRQDHPPLVPFIEDYFAHTGNQGGILSRRRCSYESSLQQINDVISEVLDEEQVQLQQVFPHYFEKHTTDGIEHTMYIGASLAPGHSFSLAYVRNLRLRQLIACCEIARQVARLQPTLEIPLDVAQLVLAQDVPLTIGFRLDEKMFDVDGAYSIRYAIVKKRIDKACRKGSEERITQPGHIAIIHSLDKEATEYLRYIDFLRTSGYLKGDVEEIVVEDLPGVAGLKALRVEVDMEARETERRKTMEAPAVMEVVC